jgi:hypothetical protein
MDEKVQRFGFFTSRFIEAPTSEDVERCAVEHIRSDVNLRNAVLNSSDAPPEVFIDEFAEVDPDIVPEAQGGFTFFPAENND